MCDFTLMQPPIAEKHAFEVGTHQPSTVSPEKVNLDKSKAQTKVLLALTNVLFLKANFSRRFFKYSFPCRIYEPDESSLIFYHCRQELE